MRDDQGDRFLSGGRRRHRAKAQGEGRDRAQDSKSCHGDASIAFRGWRTLACPGWVAARFRAIGIAARVVDRVDDVEQGAVAPPRLPPHRHDHGLAVDAE